jgi:ubiquinone/menaquinone biosynthesis C-methylase UbiE
MSTPNQHWNTIFANKTDPELGWYEADVSQTLKFLDPIPDIGKSTIFLTGAGTSVLVDALLLRCSRIVLNDISDEALKNLEKRIGTNKGKVTWLHHDISKPMPTNIPIADVWIDRAVLHFLLEEADIQTYFDNLRSCLSTEGYVLLAEFASNGAPKCAGLELHRYSQEELTKRIGTGFTLINAENYTFINPNGDPRPYIYAFYKRTVDSQ